MTTTTKIKVNGIYIYVKQAPPSAAPAVEQPLIKDVRYDLDNRARMQLAQTRAVSIKASGVPIHYAMPIGVFIAFSSLAREIFAEAPHAVDIQFDSKDVSGGALKRFLPFMLNNCTKPKTSIFHVHKKLDNVIDEYRTGRVLGMDVYLPLIQLEVERALKHHDTIWSYQAVREIMQLPEADPIFTLAVRKFSIIRYQEVVEDVEYFDDMIQDYPVFAAAMESFSAQKEIEKAARHATRQIEHDSPGSEEEQWGPDFDDMILAMKDMEHDALED